jgi:hypothetical protein
VALAVGVLGGLASGLLGIGGGLVVVPILAAWLHVPIKRAVGTSLAAMVALSAVAVVTELVVAADNLRWLPVGLLTLGALLGAALGARLILRTPPVVLGRLLAALLLLAALRLSGALDLVLGEVPQGRPPLGEAMAVGLAHVATGIAAGLVSAMFGIGGGILAVPALAVLHPDWAFQACRASSLAMIVPTSAWGALLHARLGHVDGVLARALVPGAVAGAVAGVVLANRVPGRPLEILFAAVLVVSAFRLIGRRTPREG